jgi:hypothetical protein
MSYNKKKPTSRRKFYFIPGPNVCAQKIGKQEIILSPNYGFVERGLLLFTARVVPTDEFKVYVLLACHTRKNLTYLSYSSFSKALKRTKTAAKKKLMKNLIKKQFIREVQPDDSAPETTVFKTHEVFNIPFYDEESKTFTRASVCRNPSDLKINNCGYIRIPLRLIHSSHLAHLNLRMLKVLLRLYENNWLKTHGGVDPNLIRLKDCPTKNEYSLDMYYCFYSKKMSFDFISPDLYQDLNLTEADFITSVRRLFDEQNLLRCVELVCVRDCSGRLIALRDYSGEDLSDNEERVLAIRPVHQLGYEYQEWLSEDGN